MRKSTEMPGKDGRRTPRVFNTVTQKFSNARLKLTGALYQSIRLVDVTKTTEEREGAWFTVNGEPVFAMKVNIPARPFFPFEPDGTMTPKAAEKVANVAERKIDLLLRQT